MRRRLTRAIALAVLVGIAATGAILSDMDFAYVNNLHGASGDTLVGAVYLTSSDASVTFGYDNVAGATPDTLDITAVGGGASGVLGGQDSLSFNRVMIAARDSLWSKHRAHGALHNQFAQWDSINGTWTGVTGGGLDGNAVHVNQAGEIAGIVNEVTSPASGDWLIIEDDDDSNVKAKVQIGNLPAGGGGGGTAGVVGYIGDRVWEFKPEEFVVNNLTVTYGWPAGKMVIMDNTADEDFAVHPFVSIDSTLGSATSLKFEVGFWVQGESANDDLTLGVFAQSYSLNGSDQDYNNWSFTDSANVAYDIGAGTSAYHTMTGTVTLGGQYSSADNAMLVVFYRRVDGNGVIPRIVNCVVWLE